MSVPTHADTMASSVDELNRRLRNLEQANPFEHSAIFNGALSVFDGNANLTMKIGLQDDGTYGLRAYNPTTGAVVIQLGPQTDGTFGLGVFTPAGLKVLALGGQSDGTSGLGIYDPATGAKQVQLGQQPGGTSLYGLSVLNKTTSVMQQVAGASAAFASTTQTTTATTLTTFGDEPSVTVTIGPSGQALVGWGCRVSTGANGEQGSAYLSVDGIVPDLTRFVTHSSSAGSGSSASVYGQLIITGLTQGGHTFSHQYSTANPVGGVAFSKRSINVVPL